MDVTDVDIARIPPRNLRVRRDDFVAVWREAERLSTDDWYAAGVVVTCRWLAAATVRPRDGGRSYPARAPVTKGTQRAYEELVHEEFLAAERLDMRAPRPGWLLDRPGWSEGILATLRWAWMRTGPAPIPVDVRAAG